MGLETKNSTKKSLLPVRFFSRFLEKKVNYDNVRKIEISNYSSYENQRGMKLCRTMPFQYYHL